MKKCIKCESATIAPHLSMHCEPCFNTRFEMDYSDDNEAQVIDMVISLDKLLQVRIDRLQVLKDKMDKMADEHENCNKGKHCSDQDEEWNNASAEAIQINYEIKPYIKSVIANYKVAKTVAKFGEVLDAMDSFDDCLGN